MSNKCYKFTNETEVTMELFIKEGKTLNYVTMDEGSFSFLAQNNLIQMILSRYDFLSY